MSAKPSRPPTLAIPSKASYPDPPFDLSADAAELWHQVNRRWFLDDARLAMLRQALYSLDRAELARKTLNESGLVVTGRYGQVRPHPAVRTEEVSRAAFISAMKSLGLDVVPPSHNHRR